MSDNGDLVLPTQVGLTSKQRKFLREECKRLGLDSRAALIRKIIDEYAEKQSKKR